MASAHVSRSHETERAATAFTLLVLCCVALGAEAPSGDEGDRDAKEPDSPKVTYLPEVWRPLGPDRNVVLDEKAKKWTVFDNAGKAVFTRPTRMLDDYPLDQIGYAGDSIYMRSLYHKPTKLEVTVLNADGSEAEKLETQPLARTHIARAQGLLFACGNEVFAEGKSVILARIVAYALRTDREEQGQLPTDLSRTMEILTHPDWKAFFLITSGEWSDSDRPLSLLQYDRGLKQTFSHPITAKGQRLEFVCTAKNAIHAVVTTPDHKWTFVYFDIKTGKLLFPAFDVPNSFWLRGLVSGDNVVVWGERYLTFYNPRTPKTRRSIEVQGSKSLRLGQISAVAADGRFALVGHDRYRKERLLLIYSPEGKLLEQIEIKRGIRDLKFVSEGKELLVFGDKYTARVRLDELAESTPATQPKGSSEKPKEDSK